MVLGHSEASERRLSLPDAAYLLAIRATHPSKQSAPWVTDRRPPRSDRKRGRDLETWGEL